MSTNNRAPELNPLLQGTPNYETEKARVIHELAARANNLIELIDLLKTCTGLRPPDRYGQHYSYDEHLRLALTGDYREAIQLIATKGRR